MLFWKDIICDWRSTVRPVVDFGGAFDVHSFSAPVVGHAGGGGGGAAAGLGNMGGGGGGGGAGIS